ncbi:MAG: sulfatase-like hydrolase/transferase [Hyphomicrobiaceae bacterium]
MAQTGNMVFILSDQHTRAALSCYGHDVVKTPNLDRLAARGTRFSQGYCNAPICVPSRASLATGRHIHDIGIWDNCKPYHGEVPSWGHRLMDQGHHVTSIGKLHYRSEEDDNGFNEQIAPLYVLDGVGMLFTIVRDPLPVSGKFVQLVNGAGRGDSSYTDYDRDITEQTVRWIDEEAGKHTDKPWALFVSLVCPHPPWLAPDKFYEMYPPDSLPMPTAYSKDERPKHPAYEDLRHFFGVAEPFDEPTLRKVTAAYWGMISYLDDNIGKVLDALERNGLSDKTHVIYASDHGESMGEKGLFSKCNMTEESVGVPVILAGPGVPEGRVVDAPVQLMDIFPTMLEGVGATPTEADKALPGASLFQLAETPDADRSILAQQHSAGAKSSSFMIRHGRFKYVYYIDYQPQLFDLENDPKELNDLADDPAFASVRADMDARLRALLDPEAVDRECKADQAERLANGGGQEAVVAKGSPGYTPAPGEKPVFV